MNARQAAKKWKRKYQELANMPIPKTIVTPKKIVKLQSVMTINGRDVLANMSEAEQVFAESLIRDLCKEAIKYCEIKNHYDYIMDHYTVRATWDVVDNRSSNYWGRMFSNEPLQNVVLKVEGEQDDNT